MQSKHKEVPLVATAPDTSRRRHCAGLAAAALSLGSLGLAGCGSGGGDGGTNSGNTDGSAGDSNRDNPFETPNPSDGQTTNTVPPTTGAFGGGQGKILFAEGGDYNTAIQQLDLTSRRVETLASIDGPLRSIPGGITRANDGSFVACRYELSSSGNVILHYAPDGSLLHSWQTSRNFLNGAPISPDGRQVAYVTPVLIRISDSYPFFANGVAVFLVDLYSGNTIDSVMIQPSEPPEDKLSLSCQPVYTPDGSLYVLTSVALYKIDRSTAAATRLHSLDLSPLRNAVSSPDGKSLWFEQKRGNPYGATIWSIDIATGAATRRSIRSASGGQFAPAFSPDDQWLLLQETSLTYVGIGISSYYWICAVRNSAEPIDTQNLRTAILDVGGKGITARDSMVWF